MGPRKKNQLVRWHVSIGLEFIPFLYQFYYFADFDNWYLKQLLTQPSVQAVINKIALTVIRMIQIKFWIAIAWTVGCRLEIWVFVLILLASYIFLRSLSCHTKTYVTVGQPRCLSSKWLCVCLCVCVCMCVYTYVCKVYQTGFMDCNKLQTLLHCFQ